MNIAKLTKLDSLPDRPNGSGPKQPIEKGYNVKGLFFDKPQVGRRFVILHNERNGESLGDSLGELSTSKVVEIVKKDSKSITFKTLNSIYILEILPNDGTFGP